MAVIVPTLVAAGFGAYQMIDAKEKEREANNAIDNTPRPVYGINPEEYDNLALARTLAGQGLSGASRQYLLNGANQGLSGAISGILKGGGDPNDINTSYLQYNNALGRFAMLDDQQRMQNVQSYMTERRRFSDQRDKQFQINEYAPYADTRAAAYSAQQSANAQFNQGLGMIGSAAVSAANGIGQRNDINAVRYGRRSGGTQVDATTYSLDNNRTLTAEQQSLVDMLSGYNFNNLY